MQKNIHHHLKKSLLSCLVLLSAISGCSPKPPLTPVVSASPASRSAQATTAPADRAGAIQKVDDYPLYVMHYAGDYGFDEFLRTGVHSETAPDIHPAGKARWACTGFVTSNKEGDPQFGRNFDWDHDPALLLFTTPPHGYASVSMVDMAYLGIDLQETVSADDKRLADAPYHPFDGMNEYGVSIGLMAVPHGEGGTDPRKRTLGTLHVIRLALDHARNVDEAITLLQGYNVDFSGGPPVHYLIADPSGNSAVIEYLDGKVNVLHNTQPWQVATNFILSGLTQEQALASCRRYKTAYEALHEAQGLLSPEISLSLLDQVSQDSTVWSIDYGMASGKIQVVMGRNYAHVINFTLDMKTKR